jgi:hypothetical protein
MAGAPGINAILSLHHPLNLPMCPLERCGYGNDCVVVHKNDAVFAACRPGDLC